MFSSPVHQLRQGPGAAILRLTWAAMIDRSLPLGYCTNVHPGQSVAEVLAGLDRFTVPVMQALGKPVAAGLWLARPVVDELLATPEGIAQFAEELAARKLVCYSLNAFPYGNFHADRVKENVYLPDWSQAERLTYSQECAAILAALLPDGAEGSISTLPLGFKGFSLPPDFLQKCALQLVACALWLDRVKKETGRSVRLAIEPEPFCAIETTEETLAFFELLWKAAGPQERIVREHIGVCYDVCHQAVEFEDIADSIGALDRAGVRINKVQLSCAIEVVKPTGDRARMEALRRYAEPRYLHQVFGRRADGSTVRAIDLTPDFVGELPAGFADADKWRIHFHVPINADRLGPLGTTKPAVAEAIEAVGKLSHAPHIEAETYTWEVLPGVAPGDLVEGLAAELHAANELMQRGNHGANGSG